MRSGTVGSGHTSSVVSGSLRSLSHVNSLRRGGGPVVQPTLGATRMTKSRSFANLSGKGYNLTTSSYVLFLFLLSLLLLTVTIWLSFFSLIPSLSLSCHVCQDWGAVEVVLGVDRTPSVAIPAWEWQHLEVLHLPEDMEMNLEVQHNGSQSTFLDGNRSEIPWLNS